MRKRSPLFLYVYFTDSIFHEKKKVNGKLMIF